MVVASPARARLLAALCVLLIALLGVDLMGGDQASGRLATGDSVRLVKSRSDVSAGVVVGRVPDKQRHRAVRRAARMVDAWLDAAFVREDYPRTHYPKALGAFTPQARRAARRSRNLLTNADLGRRIDGVEVLTRRIRVDLLATDRRPRVATAHLRLRLRTHGQRARTVIVRGRLFLEPTRHGWRIFGYDLRKGRR
ncbi:MAG: hypothetical protein V9G04_10645 [Nocardioides sp.]|jgi:hypothetical protein